MVSRWYLNGGNLGIGSADGEFLLFTVVWFLLFTSFMLIQLLGWIADQSKSTNVVRNSMPRYFVQKEESERDIDIG